MKRKPKTISKEKALVIASNPNHIPIQITKGYTESELRGVLRHLNLKPGFQYPPPPPPNKNKYKYPYT